MSAFGAVRPAVVTGVCWLLAALAWAVGGTMLPGGRWPAVHLLTAGAVTTLIVAMTDHFSRTLLRDRGDAGLATSLRHYLVQVGALALVAGRLVDLPVLFALGATGLLGAVMWLWWDLRTRRRAALGARFHFVVRGYERAAGAFVHAGMLGALLGLGILGSWYEAVRLAHLHLAVLGWGGLTLLATIVFFGPTVMRRRMAAGASEQAERLLPLAATALTVGAAGLLATGFGGLFGDVVRLLAAAALAVYAAVATAIARPVLRVGRDAAPSAHGGLLRGACVWLIVMVWADVAVVAAGRFALLAPVGVVALVGVLAQAILATLAYLAPLLGGGGLERRERARRLLVGRTAVRPVLFNAGLGLVAAAALVGAAAPAAGAVMSRMGWAGVATAVLLHLTLIGSALVASRPLPSAPRATP